MIDVAIDPAGHTYPGEVAEGGKFEVKVSYESNIGPDFPNSSQDIALRGRIGTEADFIKKEVKLTSSNKGNEESFTYAATFLYSAKNIVKGIRGQKEAGSANISFSVNIIERNAGRPDVISTPQVRDASDSRRLRPRLYSVSVRDTIPGAIRIP